MKIITYEEYEYEYVYDELTEKFYDDLEELFEFYSENEMELPKHVYGCQPIDFEGIDIVSSIYDELEENHFEGAWDFVDKRGLHEIQDELDKWVKEQGIGSWDVDSSIKIIIPNEEVK